MQDRERKKRRRYHALLAMSGLTAVFTFVFWQYVSRTFGDEAWKELQSDQKYDRHYVMIADDPLLCSGRTFIKMRRKPPQKAALFWNFPETGMKKTTL